eukprot:10959658-Alexandrium_andersonii.AAC.1
MVQGRYETGCSAAPPAVHGRGSGRDGRNDVSDRQVDLPYRSCGLAPTSFPQQARPTPPQLSAQYCASGVVIDSRW